MISKEELEKFKIIYKKEFDIDLSDQAALDKATELLRLIKVIYKPMSKNEYDNMQERRKEAKE